MGVAEFRREASLWDVNIFLKNQIKENGKPTELGSASRMLPSFTEFPRVGPPLYLAILVKKTVTVC